jgi:hypothetical protein
MRTRLSNAAGRRRSAHPFARPVPSSHVPCRGFALPVPRQSVGALTDSLLESETARLPWRRSISRLPPPLRWG